MGADVLSAHSSLYSYANTQVYTHHSEKKETRETDKQTEIPFGEKKSKNLKSFIKSLPKNHQKFNSKYSRNTVHQLIRFILFIQTITKKKRLLKGSWTTLQEFFNISAEVKLKITFL